MNAAARLLNQGALSRSWVVSIFFTRFHYALSLFIFSVLLSGLGLVYITNATRTLQANLQQSYATRDRLYDTYGQLLLEQSTLLTQSRIENIAIKELSMVHPTNKSIVFIE